MQVLNNRKDIGRVTVEGHTCNAPSWGDSYPQQQLIVSTMLAARVHIRLPPALPSAFLCSLLSVRPQTNREKIMPPVDPDRSGAAAAGITNQELSAARATAVRAYLTDQVRRCLQ